MEETKKAMTAIKEELVAAMKNNDVAEIDSKLMKLGCLMRKMDVAEDAEKITFHEADKIIKELKSAAKEFPNSSAAKKISGMFGWLTKHGGSSRRYGVVKSKKCKEKGIETGYAGILGDVGAAIKKKAQEAMDTVKKKAAKNKKPPKKNLREEMPAYLLNAITKEKPAHPVYGKLRY